MLNTIVQKNAPLLTETNATMSSRNGAVENRVSNNENEDFDIFRMGLAAFYNLLNVLKKLADSDFKGVKGRSDYALDVQDDANQVDEVIAEAAKGDEKTKESLPDSVIQFMRKNDIKVDGMNIDDYLKKNGPMLDKGKLKAVKGALDNEKNGATDTITQDQLQLQKVMQSYNVCANNINTLQTGLKDLLTTIARSFC